MPPDTKRSLMLSAMAAVAGADGRVGDRELAAIGEAYREVTGEDVPVDELRGTVEAGWDGRQDAVGFIAEIGAAADTGTRLQVAEACYRVLEADGEITGPEAHTFNAIVRGLGLSKKDVLDRL